MKWWWETDNSLWKESTSASWEYIYIYIYIFFFEWMFNLLNPKNRFYILVHLYFSFSKDKELWNTRFYPPFKNTDIVLFCKCHINVSNICKFIFVYIFELSFKSRDLSPFKILFKKDKDLLTMGLCI